MKIRKEKKWCAKTVVSDESLYTVEFKTQWKTVHWVVCTHLLI